MGTQQKAKKRTKDTRSITSEVKRLQDLDANKLVLEPVIEGGTNLAGQIDYSPQGVGTTSFVNVTTNVVVGTQTGT